MLKTNLNLQPNRLGEAAIAASRQMWLASLGAAVVTRDWVKGEAGDMFKTLVKEGTVVESRAFRFVGDRIETSVSIANTVWKETRKTVESTVKQAADTAVGIAQQVLPKSLPKFELPSVLKTGKGWMQFCLASVDPVSGEEVEEEFHFQFVNVINAH